MDRIQEIEVRLAAIGEEIDAASGEGLTALENEVNELKEERSRILADIETRQQLRQNIAAGNVTGTIIEQHEEETKMEERTFTLESPEYRSAFLRNLRREEMNDAEKRAFTFLTTNTSAPLPTAMQNRIVDLIGEAHPIVGDVFSLNSGSAISIPVGTAVAADAAKSEEGGAAAELEISFEDVNLSGDDFTASVKVSRKMLNMAIDAFEDYLVAKISERLGAQLAADIVLNIKDAIGANTVATGINYANVCAGFGALKRVGNVVVYGTRSSIYNKIVGMVDGNKCPIFQQPITAAAAGVILGATVKFEDALADNEILIGDPSKYVQNVVAPITIDKAREVGTSKVVFDGYTCQAGALTDDKAFALVCEA